MFGILCIVLLDGVQSKAGGPQAPFKLTAQIACVSFILGLVIHCLGGVSGLFAARHLAEKGNHRLLLLEVRESLPRVSFQFKYFLASSVDRETGWESEQRTAGGGPGGGRSPVDP